MIIRHRLLLVLIVSRQAVWTLSAQTPGGVIGLSVSPLSADPLAAAPDQYFLSGKATLRYREIGRGRPLVLVHGWAGALDDWGIVAARLARDHHIVALDVRGFGKSTKSADSSSYGREMADDVVRLLNHLKIERADLAGHSMGALIVANVASRYPQRVSTVTMISGPFDLFGFRDQAAVVADLRAGRGMERLMRPLLGAGVDSTLIADLSRQWVAQNDVPSLMASLVSLKALDIRVAAPPHVAALIICGTADPLMAASDEMAKWWPAPLVGIVGATHGLLDRHEVATAMIVFLDQNRRD